MSAVLRLRDTNRVRTRAQLYEAQINPAEAERWRKELSARKAAEKETKP